MGVPASDRQCEEQRLHEVIAEIRSQLKSRLADTAKYREQLVGTQEFLREEKPRAVVDFDDLVEVAGGMGKLKAAAKLHRFSKDRAAQLERLLDSPYFARIDFRPADLRTSPALVAFEHGSHAVEGGCRTASGQDAQAAGSRDYGGVQPIYIGISSLIETEGGKHLIFDWRAPVSSMYYDYEVGPAHYEAPLGVVSGEILLKRHFRIKDARILSMFDNSLTIYDEMLQEALAGATGDRMRNIVNTIQREQNQVIRGESRGALVVQGSAGSGKTVIALHRAAYLLYKHRTTMSAKNILMFSPGGIFVDYTSPVLPELGEEPVPQLSFGEFGAQRLRTALAVSAPLKVETQAEQLEYLLEERGSARYLVRSAGIRLKSSAEFVALLIQYARKLTDNAAGLGDVMFRGKMVMSESEAAQLLRSEYSYLPLEKRVEKIKRRVDWLLDEIAEKRFEEACKELAESPESAYLFAREIKRMARIKAHQEVQAVRDRVRAWKPVSALIAYMKLFEDKNALNIVAAALPAHAVQDTRAGGPGDGFRPREDKTRVQVARRGEPAKESGFGEQPAISPEELDRVRQYTLSRLSGGVIPYEDVPPLLLLNGLLDGFPESGDIRHVIVDEVQDYSAAQHEVLKRSYPGASFTLLGDVNQSMDADSAPGNSEELIRHITAVYGASGEPVAPVILAESYRSTKDITEFTRGIIAGGEAILAIDRPGEVPALCASRDRGHLGRAVAADVAALAGSGFESIAVICKTARESWTAYEDITAAPELQGRKVHLVKPGQNRFQRGIAVIPSYLAKGLEFEAVVIFDAGSDRYSHEADRRVLYTACTRALHKLHIHYAGTLSPFIASLDPALYRAT